MTALSFQLPAALGAREPPEARGLARDGVRLMVAERHSASITHARFGDLPAFLSAGDLLVINTSATLPAALAAHRADRTPVCVHLSTPAPGADGDDPWVIEVRSADGASPARGELAGEILHLAGGGRAEILGPYGASRRLWLARLEIEVAVVVYLARHGAPIRYGYVPAHWPLHAYQTAFALSPGSAEMPSAGRPFTPELVTRLVARGVLIAPLTLHAGVSSPERGEDPYPERYEVPPATARLVNAVHEGDGRVVAVGTTVVRALETVATEAGTVAADSGWTDLVVGPERGVSAVDGLLTGWHEPRASHLELLEAVGGEELVGRCYSAALNRGYLWHEFGDSHLILR